MKKTLTALMLCLVSICFVGCQDQNAPTAPSQVATNSDLSTQKNNCLVYIGTDNSAASSLRLASLIIKDKDGKQVGSGNFWGNYYVPYDGKLILTWEINNSGNYSTGFHSCTYTLDVASAHELVVEIGTGADGKWFYTYICVGGSMLQSWYYTDLE